MVELMVVVYVLGIIFHLGVFYGGVLEGAVVLPSRTWCRLLFWAYLLVICFTWPVSVAFSVGVSLAQGFDRRRKGVGEESSEKTGEQE